MEMWFLSMQTMQKILEKLRFYLKESIIDNPVRLQKFRNKNKNIVHSSTKRWAMFILGTLEFCQWRYLSILTSFKPCYVSVPLRNVRKYCIYSGFSLFSNFKLNLNLNGKCYILTKWIIKKVKSIFPLKRQEHLSGQQDLSWIILL